MELQRLALHDIIFLPTSAKTDDKLPVNANSQLRLRVSRSAHTQGLGTRPETPYSHHYDRTYSTFFVNAFSFFVIFSMGLWGRVAALGEALSHAFRVKP